MKGVKMMHFVPFLPSLMFVVLTLLLIAFVALCARRLSQLPATLAVCVGWLAVTGIASLTDFLHDFSAAPPRVILFAFPVFIALAIFSRTERFKRVLDAVPDWQVIGFQVFRLPMEIILWLLFIENAIPIQMTLEGRNFDILAGITAPAVAYLVFRKRLSPNLWLAWNIVSLALLFNIVAIAILSSPSPFRAFHNEPGNTIVAYFPLVWLPTMVVPLAFFGHLVSIRQALIARRENSEAKNITPAAVMLLFTLSVAQTADAQPFKVGSQTMEFSDESRNRELKTEVWYPTRNEIVEDDYVYAKAGFFSITKPVKVKRDALMLNVGKKFPLIVLSHGILGTERNYAYLCRYLASQGFIVAAPHHLNQSRSDFKDEELFRFWQRPLDISKTIDKMISDKIFAPFIDTTRIGFIGHSVGGHTGLLLAGASYSLDSLLNYAQNPIQNDRLAARIFKTSKEIQPSNSDKQGYNRLYQDSRIRAFVIMDCTPIMGGILQSSLKNIVAPMRYVGANKSDVAPSDAMYRLLKTNIPQLDSIETNAGHFVFADEGTWFGKLVAGDAFKDGEAEGINRAAIHQRLEQSVIEFFYNRLIKERESK